MAAPHPAESSLGVIALIHCHTSIEIDCQKLSGRLIWAPEKDGLSCCADRAVDPPLVLNQIAPHVARSGIRGVANSCRIWVAVARTGTPDRDATPPTDQQAKPTALRCGAEDHIRRSRLAGARTGVREEAYAEEQPDEFVAFHRTRADRRW